jgi:hypothetical protein
VKRGAPKAAPASAAIPKAKAPAAAPKPGRKPSPGKPKTIRDSFNMPVEDYSLIGQLKKRALAGALEVKKSQLLRSGLRVLAQLGDEAFKAALAAVPAVKTGHPGKKRKP